MSKRIEDIKQMKRQQKQVSPSHILAEPINEESNVGRKEEKKMTTKEEIKVERKRVSFDLRTDLHKQLKMQSLLQEKNIYILIEEALEKYLED